MGNFSYEEIASWGLLRKIKAEEIIDENISCLRLPTKDEFNKTAKQWCGHNKINSQQNYTSFAI